MFYFIETNWFWLPFGFVIIINYMETRGFTVLTLSLYIQSTHYLCFAYVFGTLNDAPILRPNIFTKEESGRCRAVEGNKIQSKEHQSKNHLSKNIHSGSFVAYHQVVFLHLCLRNVYINTRNDHIRSNRRWLCLKVFQFQLDFISETLFWLIFVVNLGELQSRAPRKTVCLFICFLA